MTVNVTIDIEERDTETRMTMLTQVLNATAATYYELWLGNFIIGLLAELDAEITVSSTFDIPLDIDFVGVGDKAHTETRKMFDDLEV